MSEHEQEQGGSPATSEERTDAAFAAFQKEIADAEKSNAAKADAWNQRESHEAKPPESEEKDEKKDEEEPEAEEKEDRTEYYARMVELDRENRRLKAQLKDQGGEDLAELAKKDPMAALGKLGIGIDDVLNRWAGLSPEDLADSPVEPTNNSPYSNEEIQSLKQQLDEMRQYQQHATMQQQMREEMEKIDSAIRAEENGSRWEYVRELRDEGSYELVLQTAAEIYKATGELPAYDEVMDLVEKHYDESLAERFARLSRFEKLKKKSGEAVRRTVPEEKKEPKAPGPTLSSSRTSDAPVPTGTLEEKARYERALNALSEGGD